MVTSLGSSLLAATMLLGQVTEGPVTPQPRPGLFGGSPQYQQSAPRPFFPWFSREERPIISRFQSWFGGGRKDNQEPPLGTPNLPPRGNVIIEGTPTSNPGVLPTSPTPLDFRKMPSTPSAPIPAPATTPTPIEIPATPTGKPLQQTNLQTVPSNVRSPLLPQLINKIGRDERFEWVTGQLEIENGVYVLYYATPETVDTFHGRILLQPQKIDMGQFRRGDLVSARGDISQRSSPQGMIGIYRLTDLQMIERPR